MMSRKKANRACFRGFVAVFAIAATTGVSGCIPECQPGQSLRDEDGNLVCMPNRPTPISAEINPNEASDDDSYSPPGH